jgi:uncharacterized protein
MTAIVETQNRLFPVFLKTEELRVLIVGAGKVGLEKLRALVENSPAAEIVVVSREVSNEVVSLAEKFPTVNLIKEDFNEQHLRHAQLVIVAANDLLLAEKIKALANKNGILVNVADTPALCDFYLGSVVQKGHVKIAVSTNGKSPTLAKRLKETLHDAIPREVNDSAENLATIRENLSGDFHAKVRELNEITSILAQKKKRNFWNTLSRTRLISYCIAIPVLYVLGYLTSVYFPPAAFESLAVTIAANINSAFFLFILAGFVAQMIDGALGMAYGVTATTFLLSFGIPPAASSASVHASEIFTSGVSGLMHLRFGNVNTKLFRSLIIPGVIGAILGAYILSSFEKYNDIIKPIVSTYTLILGGIIIWKALRNGRRGKKIRKIFPLALTGGFLDSIGGGGWGPIVSSTLIAGGRNARYTIGSVNLAEFFVSLASSVTFFTLIGLNYIAIIIGLILGGVIAAPIAAYLANRIPVKSIMILVGLVVIIVSIKRIFF